MTAARCVDIALIQSTTSVLREQLGRCPFTTSFTGSSWSFDGGGPYSAYTRCSPRQILMRVLYSSRAVGQMLATNYKENQNISSRSAGDRFQFLPISVAGIRAYPADDLRLVSLVQSYYSLLGSCASREEPIRNLQ